MKMNPRVLSMMGPCGALGMTACELPDYYDNISFVTADLQHFSGLDRFAKQYPEKMINVGIAEQNLISTSAGLAIEGFIPFATTYASFACMRDLDQVFVNMSYMKLNIKLIGLTSGFSSGILGATHMCTTDLSIMQSLPNITILSPADGIETVKAIFAAAQYDGPVYIRFTGSVNNPIVYDKDFDYTIGKANLLCTGKDIAIISTGSMVYESLRAAETLAQNDISCSVIDMNTIKPIDKDIILKAAEMPLLVTVEEHGIVGGLGDAVASVLNMQGRSKKILKIGVPCQCTMAASYQALLDKYGLTGNKIAGAILQAYKSDFKEVMK